MAKNWVEVNDDACGTYNTNRQIKFKTAMLKSNLRDFSGGHLLAKETITVESTTVTDTDANNANKKIILKNFAPFTDWHK